MKSSQKGPSIDDFIIIRTLGSGAYGEVQLVQKKSNSKQYAMKVIDKNFLRRVPTTTLVRFEVISSLRSKKNTKSMPKRRCYLS